MLANGTTIAQNRKARQNYELLDEVEAGLALTGSEVKSLRAGGVQLAESYIEVQSVQGKRVLCWVGATIAAWPHARDNHAPQRPRTLLLKRREIDKLAGAVERKGLTLVPLSLYFTRRGFIKLKLALGRGKTQADKRHTIKEREWQRQKARVLKGG